LASGIGRGSIAEGVTCHPCAGALMMMIYLPTQGTPPPTAADTAHSANSTHPALGPHRATPRVEVKGWPDIYIER